MNAKRGQGHRRPNRVRVAGWDRVVRLVAVAALGVALSACGGGGGSSSAASAAQSSEPTQSSVANSGSTAQSPATTGSSTSAQGTTGSSGTASGSTGSGSTTGSLPTATAGTVTLNWTPPTENVNGTALTNLAGYKIHYGTASGAYTESITVSNPGLATYVVSSLSPGKYYFSLTAYNSDGTESPLSSEVSATVN